MIHACTLEDESQVGAGAQVLDLAVVKKHAALAPGSVLTPGKTVPSGQVRKSRGLGWADAGRGLGVVPCLCAKEC